AASLSFQSRITTRGRRMERRLLERNRVSTTVYLSVPGGKMHRCRARNLSAMGVFLEIKSLRLPPGTVGNLVLAANLGDTVRVDRGKAVVAHVSERGAGCMVQARAAHLRPPGEESLGAAVLPRLPLRSARRLSRLDSRS